MSNKQFNAPEKEMANFDLNSLKMDSAIANLAKAVTADDVKTTICGVWSKIRPYVIPWEPAPIIGKYITAIAELLDALCKQAAAAAKP